MTTFKQTSHWERGYGVNGGLDEIHTNFAKDLNSLLAAYQMSIVEWNGRAWPA